MNKLNAKACGLAFGILWSGAVLLMGILANFSEWAVPFVKVLSVMYIGYSTAIVGLLIGAAWGFVDAFIGGFLFAWLYNKFAK